MGMDLFAFCTYSSLHLIYKHYPPPPRELVYSSTSTWHRLWRSYGVPGSRYFCLLLFVVVWIHFDCDVSRICDYKALTYLALTLVCTTCSSHYEENIYQVCYTVRIGKLQSSTPGTYIYTNTWHIRIRTSVYVVPLYQMTYAYYI